MPHWLLYWMGLTSPSGAPYLFWSGFAPSLSVFGATVVFLYRANCEAEGCWRLGLHRLAGTQYRVCGHHHPDGRQRKTHIDAIVAQYQLANKAAEELEG